MIEHNVDIISRAPITQHTNRKKSIVTIIYTTSNKKKNISECILINSPELYHLFSFEKQKAVKSTAINPRNEKYIKQISMEHYIKCE